MRMKLAVLAVLALVSVLVSAASASAVPNGMTATVSQVLVNRLGGITASGTLDCTADVKAYYASLGEPVPANLTVAAAMKWTAIQPVGRHASIKVTWHPDHASTCYNTNPSAPGAELCPVVPAPCSWITSHFGSTDTPFYLYATNGKFVPGPIHVDLTTTTGYVFIDGVLQEGVTIDVFSATGFDLRAARVK